MMITDTCVHVFHVFVVVDTIQILRCIIHSMFESPSLKDHDMYFLSES